MRQPPRISRRQVLASATLVVGGAVTGITPLALARQWRDAGVETTGGYLGTDDVTFLGDVAETIIPVTDTPGAVQAGVPGFIDHLLAAWASGKTRKSFAEGMATIRDRARELHGCTFGALDPTQREALLSALDLEFQGRPRDGFGLIKNLVVFAYYTSEIGATQTLRLDPIPGAYGCKPRSEEDRDWATNGWRLEL